MAGVSDLGRLDEHCKKQLGGQGVVDVLAEMIVRQYGIDPLPVEAPKEERPASQAQTQTQTHDPRPATKA
jgi:hypothetical protein